MEIVNMNILGEAQLAQAAQMLTDELPLGWSTFDDAMEEVDILLNDEDEPEALFFAAIEDGDVIGWCGILPEYNGRVFELHPLVVRRDQQGKGIGRKLLGAIEEAAKEKGGLTLYIGADDEEPGGETSFANVDLYDDLPKRIKEFEPGTHQTAFYMKLGFKIVGVVPDANGKGKPDIMLAKSLQ
jgi:aminoglycoside 6'-N-acetyltransferase I